MNNLKNLYPASPVNVNANITNPSADFRKNVTRVLLAIILFVVIYLGLIALGLALLAGCVYIGVLLISLKVHWVTLAAGGGLIALGVMFFVFLIKFIFVNKTDYDPYRIEINEREHPQLFAFIQELIADTNAPAPKKVFINHQVNACVFYNSNFWSMFLPVRKNLEIGLGLVNSLNISEFKAVLAHEFGHFSQKSMKLGSYVYTVNNALYNLVYEYDNWDEWLHQWSATGGIFGFFAVVTNALVSLVRLILKKAYEIINLRYLTLSREMEYHADLVALSVAGQQTMISALQRINFGAAAYDYCLNFLNSLANEGNHKPENLYQIHQQFIKHLAKINDLSIQNGLPIITPEDLAKNMPNQRVIYKDQWASHPTLAEREKNLLKYDVQTIPSEESPWLLFHQPETLQIQITNRLYDVANTQNQTPTNITWEEIETKLLAQERKNEFLNDFNEFYKNRFLQTFEVEKLLDETDFAQNTDYEAVYSTENIQKINLLLANEDDLQTLINIQNGQIPVKYFEFDGVKYAKKQVKTAIQKLNDEIKAQKDWLLNLDKQAFIYNYTQAKRIEEAENYKNLYIQHQQIQSELDLYKQLALKTAQFYQKAAANPELDEDDVKKLTLESNSLANNYLRLLENSEKINLQQTIGEISLEKDYRHYLLPETRISLSVSMINFDEFMQFYQQVFDVLDRLENLYGQSLKNLLQAQKNYA
jgi:Zn-dependent protease with chaperone function